jgi:hypothetical protein
VSSTSGFGVGDNVVIDRVVTQAWVDFMGMNDLVRDGSPQTWLSPGDTFHTDRIVTAVSGNTLTFDAPLTDSFDSALLGTPAGTVSKYTWPGQIVQVGLEHLRILAPIGTTVYSAVTLDRLVDGWILDVVGQETQNAFNVNGGAKRVTLDHVINAVTTTQTRSAGTADIAITGSQVFLNACQSNGTGDWPLATQAMGTGPAVALNFSSSQRAGVSPHQRWYTGLLTDSSSLPNAPSQTPGIAYRSRGTAGSGQGWASGWAVAWNVDTPFLLVQEPPGAHNWCIGCVGSEVSAAEPGGDGTPLPDGIFESTGTHVTPASLYLAQLCERLGPTALANIGYGSSNCVTTPGDFSIAASPASQAVVAGGSVRYTVTLNPSGGFASDVGLGVAGLPSGAVGGFDENPIPGGSGSATLVVTTSSTTPVGTYTLTIAGASGSLRHPTTVTLVVKAGCVTATAGGMWQNMAFPARTGSFTVAFDATPSASPINSVMALSLGAQTQYGGFAALARFAPSGNIDARSGNAYKAASAIPYSGGLQYHFRLAISVAAHTYSIFVTPPGGSERTVGANFAFRDGQTGTNSLDHFGVFADTGANTTCDFFTGP